MTEDTKRCAKCGEHKSVDNFYVIQRKDRNKPQLYHRCKFCCSDVKSNSKAYYRDWELKKKYGISLEEYNEQVSLRENHCDICCEKVKTLHVDHNHDTGKIRGYLCGSCNRGIGLLKDNSAICREAAGYLEKHGD
jgi:hypothetical protein